MAEVHAAANSTITAPMVDAEVITDLLLALRNAHIGLSAVSVKSPTLDEVFLTLTGQPAEQQTIPVDN
jgi:ABC-2 type transport system ATP-binding protein